ncbi:hypothetical protein GQ600_17713 [Phytophthora cactorum]|nr:hypothetical protein GQ600_17713 [Phytophthora cactorum]
MAVPAKSSVFEKADATVWALLLGGAVYCKDNQLQNWLILDEQKDDHARSLGKIIKATERIQIWLGRSSGKLKHAVPTVGECDIKHDLYSAGLSLENCPSTKMRGKWRPRQFHLYNTSSRYPSTMQSPTTSAHS